MEHPSDRRAADCRGEADRKCANASTGVFYDGGASCLEDNELVLTDSAILVGMRRCVEGAWKDLPLALEGLVRRRSGVQALPILVRICHICESLVYVMSSRCKWAMRWWDGECMDQAASLAPSGHTRLPLRGQGELSGAGAMIVVVCCVMCGASE